MLHEIDKDRYNKLIRLQENGIYPFGRRYEVTYSAKDIIDNFSEDDVKKVCIAGRIVSLREHGKSAFAHIKDITGKIQVYAKKDVIGDDKFSIFKGLDLGDIIGVEGRWFKTRTGEITVLVENFTLLSKSLRPLPKEWYGLKDIETRYRQRYVDLIVNDDVKQIFITRTKIIKAIREFLDTRDFLEVETPMMQSMIGGAAAQPFVTYHNALNMELYMRIAPELYLKRLIVGGLERIYELNRNFRNEGVSTRHNPEFTMLEVYQAYADYEDMMRLTEEMINEVCQQVKGTTKIEYQGRKIDIAPPWERVTVCEIISKVFNSDVKDFEDIKRIAEEKNISIKELIDDVLDVRANEKLIQPVFVVDFPVIISPLAKSKPDDNNFTERFEFFIAGQELGNAYSELNDPIDQRKRFVEQDPEHVDEDFLRALEYGMPPCGGLGIGIDRLVMILTDSASIRDVIFFPQLKREVQ
jgi:lysyl-tRNA synthetase class 2